MFAHILVATDGSANALSAAVAAAEIAKRFGSRLTIVTVSPPPAITPEETPSDCQIERDILDETQQRIMGATGDIVDRKNIAFQGREEHGSPAELIGKVAEQEHCDLIVLRGSVPEHLAQTAHCPILIVR